MSNDESTGAVDRPADVPDKGLVLFVVKATPTSTANTVKVLILLHELAIPHQVYIVPSPGSNAWFLHSINPLGMVPALEDDTNDTNDTGTGSGTGRVNVFESASCLEFVVDKYDIDGLWKGRDLRERAVVRNWMTVHTAGLGPTSKWWLWFKVKHPGETGVTLDKLSTSMREQYTLLDTRLSLPNQQYIALADRPTVVDLHNLPFCNEKIAATAGYDFNDWPQLKAWSERMLGREKVREAFGRVQGFIGEGLVT